MRYRTYKRGVAGSNPAAPTSQNCSPSSSIPGRWERKWGLDFSRALPERARHQLATYTGRSGDRAGARDLLAALLPIEERVFGPEHRTP
jgi:hypothetical protein